MIKKYKITYRAVSRQKKLSVLSAVANVQKQGAEGAECTEASNATMFQKERRHRSVVMEAFSKYDAKQRFFRTYPGKEIVSIEVVEHSQTARGNKKTVDKRFSPSVTDQKGEGQ